VNNLQVLQQLCVEHKIPATEFELTFLMAALHFKQTNCEAVVLEVGPARFLHSLSHFMAYTEFLMYRLAAVVNTTPQTCSRQLLVSYVPFVSRICCCFTVSSPPPSDFSTQPAHQPIQHSQFCPRSHSAGPYSHSGLHGRGDRSQQGWDLQDRPARVGWTRSSPHHNTGNFTQTGGSLPHFSSPSSHFPFSQSNFNYRLRVLLL